MPSYDAFARTTVRLFSGLTPSFQYKVCATVHYAASPRTARQRYPRTIVFTRPEELLSILRLP